MLRNGNISEYDGNKYINCFSSTMVSFNPEISEAIKLKEWFDIEIQDEKN